MLVRQIPLIALQYHDAKLKAHSERIKHIINAERSTSCIRCFWDVWDVTSCNNVTVTGSDLNGPKKSRIKLWSNYAFI